MRQYPKIKKIHLYQKANTILPREQNPEKRSGGMQITMSSMFQLYKLWSVDVQGKINVSKYWHSEIRSFLNVKCVAWTQHIAKLSLQLYLQLFVCRPSRIVTSPLISTIWCFRLYKPYIFCEDMILATCQCQQIFCCWVEPSLLLSSSK